VFLAGILAPAVVAGEFHLGDRTFTVPDGFTIERVAGPPLVNRPITCDFDERGRLYVADSSGSNDPVQKQLAERPHRIVGLEDTDGDGLFDKQTVFADKMMFPEGTMWLDGSLYVSAPPSIWRLTDSDGDGVAESREEWFQGKTLTGCANDLHGPYAGPDGWIYWCKGAFAEQTYARPGKAQLVTRAAHIFRCRPDGAGIEPVMTGGMDNPVDVVFTPGGERIFTTTFLQHPGGGRRDGLIHAVYGGVYGKVHDVIDGHKRTSADVMPVLEHLGPAAPCGLTRYESAVFGAEYQDNLFAALFNLRKITRHVLTPSGATFTSRAEDFVTSPDQDFHPTDVQEDADGSLIVVDTGGWYKLCCPSSQLVKPDVLGGIYRVRRIGASKMTDARWWDRSQSRQEWVRRLDDPRPAVRQRAIAAVARTADHEMLRELRQGAAGSPSAQLRRNAAWAACRMPGDEARALAREFLDDADETVRQVALHGVGLWRDAAAVPSLISILKARSPQNRRAAAEALGRIGDKTAVPALLDAVAGSSADDQVLDHSLTYALIEIGDRAGTATGLKSASVRARRAALIALDQMDGGGLEPSDVAPLLAGNDAMLKETASWIVGRHPEWGGALAGVLRALLAANALAPAERAGLALQLGRLAHAGPIQELLAERLADASAPLEERLTALDAMGHSGVKEVPRAWIDGLGKIMGSSDDALVRQAIAAAHALPLPKEDVEALRDALIKIGSDERAATGRRLEALAAVPGGLGEVPAVTLAFLRAELQPDRPVAERVGAADVLARSKLEIGQAEALAVELKTTGPLEVDRLLAALENTPEESVGLAVVGALAESPALSALRTETLKPRLAKFGPRVQERAGALYERLDADFAQQRAKLEDYLGSMDGGDIRRGQGVFNGTKAACASCHAIGYLGGKVGPDLTKIGSIRTERDLLESILFPSASFVRSYEPIAVATKDGRVTSGLLRRDSADEVILATSATEEVRIARGDIDEIRPGTVSVMPAGLDQQLTRQELADLVAFLRACK
jgi:putative membrane-bound dehydrogenase-like protein